MRKLVIPIPRLSVAEITSTVADKNATPAETSQGIIRRGCFWNINFVFCFVPYERLVYGPVWNLRCTDFFIITP